MTKLTYDLLKEINDLVAYSNALLEAVNSTNRTPEKIDVINIFTKLLYIHNDILKKYKSLLNELQRKNIT